MKPADRPKPERRLHGWGAVFLWLLAPLVAGCAAASPVRADPAPTTEIRLMGRYTTPPATLTPDPSPTLPPATFIPPSAAVTAAATDARTATPAAPPTATTTAAPTASSPAVLQVCSPIADILLADLPRLISDGYHPPPSSRSDARHPAIDIAFYNWKGFRQIAGAPVQAVLAGRIAAAEVDSYPFGNVLIIETEPETLPVDLKNALRMNADQSLYTLYAHLEEDSLRHELGDLVIPCETLGRVGRTGNSGAAHLHLEMRLGPRGATFQGFSYYTDSASKTEKENYRRWATGGEFRHFDPLRLLLWDLGYRPTLIPAHNWSN